MKSPSFLLQCLQIFSITILLAVSSVADIRRRTPRLSTIRGVTLKHPEILSAPLSEDLQTFYYNQTLDHFNYKPQSYIKFKQRYVMNFKYWGGPNAPILAYLGAEESIDGDLRVVGFLNDNARGFKALQIYIEHRYYGQSIPFGSREEAMRNASTFGYFNSAQAIADYAEILLHVKKKLHAQHSPVIVIGASYGGMLAAWFRLKYPHIAVGALASSAPILYFLNIKLTPPGGYYSVVSNDFKEVSETCYHTIRKSWSVIDSVASMPNGLAILSQKFNTCGPLSDASELVNFLEDIYNSAAQYDSPSVNVICGGIDGASSNDILSKIFAGVVASFPPNSPCYVNQRTTVELETYDGWSWQTCSEMVMPFEIRNDTMFPSKPFDLKSFEDGCMSTYGVRPRPHWVTSYYGGNDIKLVLRRFGSNIIFSNGLKDPFSSGGVLENLSESLLAVSTKNGFHCLDIIISSESDPKWLVEQRSMEVKIIKRWLAKYYRDPKALTKL
ncbi:hypothetical protein SLE2022_005130 [Rubroshorea leprosula]